MYSENKVDLICQHVSSNGMRYMISIESSNVSHGNWFQNNIVPSCVALFHSLFTHVEFVAV